MSSLDQLPADERAVLSLLLRQGRAYAQVASLLAIDESAVRGRAQRALAALGGGAPPGLDAADAARIGDYVLGQLPEDERIVVLSLLLDDAPARAWARRVSDQVAPLATVPLPEVPPEPDTVSAPAPEAAARRTRGPEPEPEPELPASAPEPAGLQPARAAPGALWVQRAASRRGAVLVLAAALAIAAIVVFATQSGGTSSPPTGPIPASAATTTTGTSNTAQSVKEAITLRPTASSSTAAGSVAIISSGGKDQLAFTASKLPSPGQAHYVLWLYDSSSHFKVLGAVQTAKDGSVSPVGVTLPADASGYHGVVLTLETSNAPTSPGQQVLRGSGKSPL
jgi:hypothetical protein